MPLHILENHGLAQAFIIGKEFIGDDSCALVLGDNIFYGTDLREKLRNASERRSGATIFTYAVKDPERYGVVELDKTRRPLSIEEKPKKPKSRYAVTGLYFFDELSVDYAKQIKPSARGELEITDVHKQYLENEQLQVEFLGRGTAWLDTGTIRSLLAAANFVENIEERQGLKICCPEEIAYRQGFISAKQLRKLAEDMGGSNYGDYLMDVLNDPGL